MKKLNDFTGVVFGSFLLLGLALVSPCTAQIETTGDNSDDFDGTGPWASSSLVIGQGTDSEGALIIEGDGTPGEAEVINAGIGRLGTGVGSKGEAFIVGENALWSNTSSLHIGQSSSSRRSLLFLGEGGRAVSDNGFLGDGANSKGDVLISGDGSEWDNSAGFLSAGSSGDSKITIEDGGLMSNTWSVLGTNGNGTGSVEVTSGGHWINSGTMSLGRFGSGGLSIEDGGLVTTGTVASPQDTFLGVTTSGTTQGVGIATVSGDGSVWTMNGSIEIGDAGEGRLEIRDNGMVTNFNSILGDRQVSGTLGSGVATVENGGEWHSDGFQYIGNNGIGELQVNAGGLVTNSIAVIGREAGGDGSVVVDGAGAQWVNDSTLRIGDFGTGELTISNGGYATNNDATLGSENSGTGTAIITGAGSVWENTDDLYVGGTAFSERGSGSIQILDGGLVTVADDLRIWGDTDGDSIVDAGFVNVDGGKLIVDTLDLREGSELFSIQSGTLVAARVRGDLVQEGGTISVGDSDEASPGSSIGSIRFDDGFTMEADGTIRFEIASLNDFDTITVEDNALLDGVIDIDLIGFDAVAGNGFQLIDADGQITGSYTFDFSGAVLGPNLSWYTDDFASSGTIGIIASVPEPGSLALLIGMGSVAMMRRRRRS